MPSGSGGLRGSLTPKRANRPAYPRPRKGERASPSGCRLSAQAGDLEAIASR